MSVQLFNNTAKKDTFFLDLMKILDKYICLYIFDIQ